MINDFLSGSYFLATNVERLSPRAAVHRLGRSEPAMLLAVPVIALVLAGKPSPPPAASGVAFNTSQGSYMVR